MAGTRVMSGILVSLVLLLPARLPASPAVPVTGFTPGHVMATGLNKSGELGDGTKASHQSLVLANAAGILTVAAGAETSLALDAEGQAWSWGRNQFGQLGDGTTKPAKKPVKVAAPNRFKAIAAGALHSLALDVDGRVWAWGFNNQGQLGDGTVAPRSLPAPVAGLGEVIAVAAGADFSLALRADGTVWAWGANHSGQLGDGTLAPKPSPTQALGPAGPLTGITAISASSFGAHSLALRVDGTVWAWGINNHGQLGDGTLTPRSIAVPVQTAIGVSPQLNGVTAIAAGGLHSLALGADGRAWAWGWNSHGQLGDETTVDRTRAVRVHGAPGDTSNLSGVIGISAGAQHSMALRADCRAVAWGLNEGGQLADGTTQDRAAPVFMLNGKNKTTVAQQFLTAIAAGSTHSLVVIGTSRAMAWGNNDHGQLGDGSQTTHEFAAVVTMEPGKTLFEKAIAAGARHSLALRSGGPFPPPGGTVYAWGANEWGQLADDSGTEHSTPFHVQSVEGAAAMGGGGAFSVALLANGTVLAWGDNARGQLALGDFGSISEVPGFARDPAEPDSRLRRVIAVAAGRDFCLALKVDGTVWAWGANDQGQLGDGTIESRALPVQVRDVGGDGYLTGVKAIAAGALHSLALKADGTVWAWGANGRGQVGDGTFGDQVFPVPVGLPPDRDAPPWAIGIAGGGQHSLLLLATGHVRAWGANDRGQLGQDTPTDQPLPIHVLESQHQGDLAGVKEIAGGGEHSLALNAVLGGIAAWGSNLDGQLGTAGPSPYTSRPDFVLDHSGTSLRRVGAIAAGASHSLGLMFPDPAAQP